METNPIENFFIKQRSPNQEVYLALRNLILSSDVEFSEHWKYKLPFYYYKGKPFGYFHHNKKNGHPYMGIVKGNEIVNSLLEQGNRKKMKVLELNPNEDIPIQEISCIFETLKMLY